MKKCFHIALVGLLLWSFSGYQDSEGAQRSVVDGTEAVISGIPIDEELAQLLGQIVPYNADGEYALPEEKRFLFNLNKLINEDLAEQSDEYKLAACKLALRTALAITKRVDSIEVRYAPTSGWALGGYVDDKTQWGGHYEDPTIHLFRLNEGKITYIWLDASVGTCGGLFSGCCGSSVYTPGLDDGWFQNFLDLGLEKIFPFTESEYSPKIIKYLSENSKEPIEQLTLSKIKPEGIASLVLLKDLKHLKIDVYEKDMEANREAFFELFPKLPQLHTIEMQSGPVTQAQMQKLGECQNLTHLILMGFSAKTPNVFEPINRLKKLEKLAIISTDRWSFPLWGGTDYLLDDTVTRYGKLPSVRIHDLPNLTHYYVVGTTQNYSFTLTNLPKLEFLVTDAPILRGDIFTEKMPPNLRILTCVGGTITQEQIQHIGALKHLESLGLYGLAPDHLLVFLPLRNAKNLKHLSLVFSALSHPFPFSSIYDNMVLTTPETKLSTLRVKFPESGHNNKLYLKLKIPKLADNYTLDVKNVLFIDEIPPLPGQLSCHGSKMSYAQFLAFKNGGGTSMNKFRFEELTLTDINEDDLFVDFVFPFELTIKFCSDMEESLKGKTLHFRNCDRMRMLYVRVPSLKEIEVRLSGLNLWGCSIGGN